MRLHVILQNCLVLLSLAALSLWQIGCGGTTGPATGTGGTGGGATSGPKVSTGQPANDSNPSEGSGDSKASAGSKASGESDDENMEIESNDNKGAEKSEPGEDDEQAGSTTGAGRDVPEAAPEEDKDGQ